MLLRQEAGDGVDVLSVAGPVDRSDAERLAGAVARARARRPRAVVVDLADVTALADDAVPALRALPAEDVRLCGCGDAVRGLDGAVAHATREDAVAAAADRRAAPRRTVPIPHTLQGPAEARRVVQETAQELGLAEEGHDLVLVVSEMVTNAVRHAAPPVELQIAASADTVVVAVADGSPTRPAPREADEDAEGGRGLALVDLLCDSHGVRSDPPGKKVWAAVRRRTRRGEPT